MSKRARRRTPRPRHDAALPRRGSRLRLWLTLGAFSVGWKVLVFTLGAALPRWLIADGIEQLPPPLREYGHEAKRTALALWNGPIERHGVVRTVRVVSVHGGDGRTPTPDAVAPNAKAPNAKAPDAEALGEAPSAASGGSGPDDELARCDGHGAVVRAYTYFAIPYSEARTRCDTGIVEYRVFRRRKQHQQAVP